MKSVLLKKIGKFSLVFSVLILTTIVQYRNNQSLVHAETASKKTKEVETIQPKTMEQVIQTVDKQMKENLDQYGVPASTISIVKDGQLVFSKGYGQSGIIGNEVTAEKSMFRIASTTKLFTWTAVMQLVEEGKIDLDENINTYLKSVKIPDTFDEPITMRHLMTHTAGFEEGGVGYQITVDEKKLPGSISETLNRHPLKRVRPVGELPSYSNYGATLAGLIVEEVSGIPYNEYIQKNIFDPLGMTYATMKEPLPEKFKANNVLGLEKKGGKFTPGIPTYEAGFRPAGGATVAADEMAKFMQAHLNNGTLGNQQILKPETAKLMHQTAYQFHPNMPSLALGFAMKEQNGQKIISHSGSDMLFATELFLVPEQNLGIFISHSGGDGYQATQGIMKSIFDGLYPVVAKNLPEPPENMKKSLDRFAGNYIFTRRNSSQIDKFFSLFAGMKVNVSGDKLVIGQGAEQQKFRGIGENLFQQVGGEEKLAFHTNEAGKVTAMTFDFMPDMPLVPAKLMDRGFFWLPIIGGTLFVFLISLIVGLFNFKKYQQWPKPKKFVYALSNATAGMGILTSVLILIKVMNMDMLQRLSEVPMSVKAILVLPIFFSALTIGMIYGTFKVWRESYFGLIGRIGYTVIFISAFALMVFFKYWHLFGWQFG